MFTEKTTAKSSTDHHKDFSEKLGSEQLEHAVEDVLPAVVQYVTVSMCQTKHGPRRQLSFRIVTEHDWNVFNRLLQITQT